MRQKIFLLFALLCAVVQGAWADDGWSSASSYDKDSDADKPTHYDTYGGRSDVHVIKTAANYLYVMDKPADYCSKNIYLDINVDVSSKTWINGDYILGVYRYLESWGSGYRGTFYGNGHTIRINLDYDSYGSYQGPFGVIAKGGKVQDLNVEGTIFLKKMDDGNGTDLVGGICGENNGTIENCSVSASVSSEEKYLGGITGRNTGTGTISNCRVSGNVSSSSRLVGGIAGENNGTISNCWVSGNVSSDWKNSGVAATAKVGGIAGENNSTIQFCCMAGDVTNNDADVGGLVGCNDGTLSHCTFYGTRHSSHDQASIYVGDSGTEEYLFGIFSLDEYNAASGKDMYRHAIRYTYDVTVNIEGHGTVRTRALDEDDVPGTCAGQTFSLNVTSGTMARYTLTDADGNNIDLQGHAHDWSSFWFVMPKKNVTATVYFYADWPTQGAGTAESPYIISSADDWYDFAYNVRIGRSYSGQCVKLTSDISVSTMAGAYQADDNCQPFSGTFDGDGHTLTINVSNQSRFAAPFKCVNGATIKNLRTAGTIDGTGNSDGKLLAGLVGVSFGNTTISGCRSSVTLTTNFGEDAALGGLVAGTKGGSLTIEGCVFDGSMTGSTNTRCAGIAGFEYEATTTTITNTLFAPATLTVSTTDDTFTKTFSRDDDATITNCYYTKVLGAAQGTQAIVAITAPTDLSNLVEDYGMVKAYAHGILVGGTYYGVSAGNVSLADDDDNSTKISNANGYVADVTLSGRTLYKDGAWNTICLPFDVTIAGSPLAGATARPLTSASISGSTLTLTFGDAVTTLEAGTPYIIKWTADANYVDDDEHNIVSPVFSGVTIDADADGNYDTETASPAVTTDERVRFLGTYKSTAFDAEDKSILLMGGNNTLYYPTRGAGIGAQRAYFKIGSDAALARRLTAFNIDFGDDEATGIISIENGKLTIDNASDAWYSLDGRKLQGKPSVKGVYVNKGRKVVIK